MPDAQLIWPNKDQMLRASGEDGYVWIRPNDERLAKPGACIPITKASANHGNILAIGDGLEVLEALKRRGDVFGDGIRLVYIDPPFNTQVKFRQYSDTMKRPMWLSMIRDRLLAVRPMLAPNASIWVHLDDSEVHRARMIMDEVFGEDAFVASVIWQKKSTRDSRAAFSSNHDTILVYAPCGPKAWKKSRNLVPGLGTKLINRDNDPRGPWKDAPFTAPGFRKAQQYKIITPSGKSLHPPLGRSWYATEPAFRKLIADNKIWFPKDGGGSPRIKRFTHHLGGLVPFTIWDSAEVGSNDDAKRHLMTLFPGKEVFDTPKPELLLERIIHIATKPGDLVVDIFAGSGTTASVAHKMRRRWIVSERNPQTVMDFTWPRMHRVVSGKDSGGVTELTQWSGGGSFDVVYVPPRFTSPSENYSQEIAVKSLLDYTKRFGNSSASSRA